MKSFNIWSLFLLLAFVGTSTLSAQTTETPFTQEQKEQMAQAMEQYAQALDLSNEQKAEFEAITKKYAGKMLAVKNGGGGKLQKYRKVKAIRKDKDAEMEVLLSDAQFQLYEEMQKEMQAKQKANQNS